MRCPLCDSETKVTDSRETSKGIRRRRECLDCLTRFSTYESMVVSSMDKHLQEKYMNRLGVLEHSKSKELGSFELE